MNERMYGLINQCFIGTTDGKLSDLNTVANIEKFAELIIKECAAKAWWAEQYDIGSGLPISKQITEHFGIED